MRAVRIDVPGIVDQIDRRRCQTEYHERHRRGAADLDVVVADGATQCGQRRGHNEDVLDPLPWPHGPSDSAQYFPQRLSALPVFVDHRHPLRR
ncbi:Uncharacterised protein [Mycobacteroides abscessus subsp. abscessus]|nr:Uncharacterised protein [Mycobacteroides abscessus subsp. abscessus]